MNSKIETARTNTTRYQQQAAQMQDEIAVLQQEALHWRTAAIPRALQQEDAWNKKVLLELQEQEGEQEINDNDTPAAAAAAATAAATDKQSSSYSSLLRQEQLDCLQRNLVENRQAFLQESRDFRARCKRLRLEVVAAKSSTGGASWSNSNADASSSSSSQQSLVLWAAAVARGHCWDPTPFQDAVLVTPPYAAAAAAQQQRSNNNSIDRDDYSTLQQQQQQDAETWLEMILANINSSKKNNNKSDDDDANHLVPSLDNADYEIQDLVQAYCQALRERDASQQQLVAVQAQLRSVAENDDTARLQQLQTQLHRILQENDQISQQMDSVNEATREADGMAQAFQRSTYLYQYPILEWHTFSICSHSILSLPMIQIRLVWLWSQIHIDVNLRLQVEILIERPTRRPLSIRTIAIIPIATTTASTTTLIGIIRRPRLLATPCRRPKLQWNNNSNSDDWRKCEHWHWINIVVQHQHTHRHHDHQHHHCFSSRSSNSSSMEAVELLLLLLLRLGLGLLEMVDTIIHEDAIVNLVPPCTSVAVNVMVLVVVVCINRITTMIGRKTIIIIIIIIDQEDLSSNSNNHLPIQQQRCRIFIPWIAPCRVLKMMTTTTIYSLHFPSASSVTT
jgi:hypothetical protein